MMMMCFYVECDVFFETLHLRCSLENTSRVVVSERVTLPKKNTNLLF